MISYRFSTILLQTQFLSFLALSFHGLFWFVGQVEFQYADFRAVYQPLPFSSAHAIVNVISSAPSVTSSFLPPSFWFFHAPTPLFSYQMNLTLSLISISQGVIRCFKFFQ